MPPSSGQAQVRSRSLRDHLLLLVLVSLLPVVVFSAAIVWRLARGQQEQTERGLLTTASAMMAALEGEVAGTVRTLQVLAQSESLSRDDLKAFSVEIRRVKASQGAWLDILLLSPSGEILLSATEVFDRPTRAVEMESVEKVVRERKPVLGSLKQGQGGIYAFPVRVPSLRGDKVHYILTAVISSEGVAQIVNRAAPMQNEELTRTVVDSRGTVVFRSRRGQDFLGKPATATFSRETTSSAQGIYQDITLDGIRAYVLFRHSEEWGWVTAVVAPRELVESPLWQSLGLLSISGAVAVLLGLGFAVVLVRRTQKGMGAAADVATALVDGKGLSASYVGIREVDKLNALLVRSAALLRERESETDAHRAGLEKAVKARDEFLSIASHELRTPLASLSLETYRLEQRLRQSHEEGRADVSGLLDRIRRQTKRLGRLIEDMLDIARIHAGKLELRVEPVDLAALVQNLVERLWPQQDSGPRVQISAPNAVVGAWDPDRIEQVVTNLIGNAVRYGGGTPIRVEVSLAGEMAVLKVADGGPGIPVEDRERIFQRFERGVSRHEASGLGLGLFIVRNIVEMHGGTVTAQGGMQGGAVFVVCLPGANWQPTAVRSEASSQHLTNK